MKVGTPDERLRNERFAQGKGKTVDYAAHWNPSRKPAKGSPEDADLLAIIYAISAGNLIPERCYRNGIDRDRDDLLQDYGIKHLHLGGDNSDAILFLAEYEEFVLLLEIGSHTAFAVQPVGSALRSLHDNALRGADTKADAQRKQRVANRKGIAKAGLRQRAKRD